MEIRSRKIKQLVLFYFILAAFVYMGITTASQVTLWFWAILSIPLALYIADAIGGLVHFFCDYIPCRPDRGLKDLFYYKGNRSSKDYLSLKAKVMKRVTALEEVMFDFKVHHPRPMAMARRGTVYLMLTGIVFIGSPFIGLLFLLKWLAISPGLQFFLLMTAFFLMFSQFAHACAHNHSKNRFVLFLQKTRLFIPPEVHDHHHVVLNRDFAILNGWSNPAVNVLVKFCFKKGWVTEEGLIPK